jgi:ribosomal small subunit protein bTHX
MGKGDQKTRRGKLFSGSYGVLRPRKKRRAFSVIGTTKKTAVEPEISKASPKSKAANKPKAEPVAEEVKPVAEEVKPVAEEVKPVAEEVKPVAEEVKAESEPVKPVSDAKKPAAKKETVKKEAAKKDPK